jgi:hypothetical protein
LATSRDTGSPSSRVSEYPKRATGFVQFLLFTEGLPNSTFVDGDNMIVGEACFFSLFDDMVGKE